MAGHLSTQKPGWLRGNEHKGNEHCPNGKMDLARIYSEQNSELLWSKLLKAKYRINEMFSSNPVGCSPFWHSIHKVKEHFRLGVKFFPGSRSNIRFWKDIWIGEEPLSLRFPTLFEKSSDTYLKNAQAYTKEGWWIPFRRNWIRRMRKLGGNCAISLRRLSWKMLRLGSLGG
jgi:hypothetical protein